MRLPFTEEQFLEVFAAYNSTLWPIEVGLWIATAWLVIDLVRGRARPVTVSILAVHWGWSGAVYHALYFSRINPAAWIFAALFVVQAAAFVWFGNARGRLTFEWRRTPRHALAGLFLLYSLVYPVVVGLTGHALPRAPAFAVPCPTTLFTAGLLLTAVAPPRALFAIPIAWSLVGGSAALLLNMPPDLMLFAAAACLIWPFRTAGTSLAPPPC